ncbi:hypothetical protein D3C80_1463350 [compost metagenome]
MSKISRKPILPSSLSSQLLNGTTAAEEIQQVADYLADLMRGVHGCEYSIQIDHQVRFILIAGKSL